MFLFKKRDSGHQRVEHLKSNVSKAFSKVKQDTKILYQWIEHLSYQNSQLKQVIEDLRGELSLMPSSHHEVRQIIDKYYSFDTLFSRVEEIENRIDSIESSRHRVSQRFTESRQKLKENRQNLKETIVKKVTKNSKEYIKNILISLVEKYQNISGPQLKEMIVDEQRLCSKSSFYRLIDELERDEQITTFQSGKSKFFALNVSSRN